MGEGKWLCLPGRSTVGGTIVDIAVEHSNVNDGIGGYRRIRGGGNSKYTTIIAIQIQYMTNIKLEGD